MRVNAAPVGARGPVPKDLLDVQRLGLRLGRASGGAFDIDMGDAVTALRFGSEAAAQERIRAAMSAPRRPRMSSSTSMRWVRKRAPVRLDLNGNAKGQGVDRLAETLREFGIVSGLVGIDGEMRAMGLRPDGMLWVVAVEAPDPERSATH